MRFFPIAILLASACATRGAVAEDAARARIDNRSCEGHILFVESHVDSVDAKMADIFAAIDALEARIHDVERAP